MEIETVAPFRLSREKGAQHAVKESIQVTVLADAGEAKLSHRVGEKAEAGLKTRWLHIDLKDKGLHVFVNGTHVVITGKDLMPTFDLNDSDKIIAAAFKYMRVEKDARGRYVIDTENNRRVLGLALETAGQAERNRLLAWARHALARLVEPKT